MLETAYLVLIQKTKTIRYLRLRGDIYSDISFSSKLGKQGKLIFIWIVIWSTIYIFDIPFFKSKFLRILYLKPILLIAVGFPIRGIGLINKTYICIAPN